MIGAVQDVEEKMFKWGEEMEPHFISWNAAGLHCFEFTFPDVWSRHMNKSIPSRNPEVSAGHKNDVYTPARDNSSLKWPIRETEVILEIAKESRGGVYLTIEKVAPHGEEPVEVVINDQLFFQAGDLTITALPDSVVDMRQDPSGPGHKPEDGGKKEDANKKKTKKISERTTP